MNLPGILTELLNQNQPFACYRLPLAQQPVLLHANALQLQSAEQAVGKSGFIVAPFVMSDPVLFFPAQKQFVGWDIEDFCFTPKNKNQANISHGAADQQLSFEAYCRQAEKLIEAIRQGIVQKVVLSRMICLQLETDFQAGAFFRQMCEKYPEAFVYVFNDGQGRCWMGASPELLLQAASGKGITVALAGTQASAGLSKNHYKWQSKEVREQQFVSDYILKILQEAGVDDYLESELHSITAGPVAHLRKSFEFSVPSGIDPLQLAWQLHPTPAVCGLPMAKARELILSTEPHSRAYYSGFLGPVSNKAQANLFVNLRCMRLLGNNACLFAGGGLLADSIVENEWEETTKKAETLIGMLKK